MQRGAFGGEIMEQRICRKCLLRDMPGQESFQNMYEYIKRLPEEDKVSLKIYEERLRRCKECDSLISGMCRLCGCYVEMRAVMKIRECPDISPRWKAVKN